MTELFKFFLGVIGIPIILLFMYVFVGVGDVLGFAACIPILALFFSWVKP